MKGLLTSWLRLTLGAGLGFSLLISPNALAWKLGQPIDKFLRDAGPDIERGVQNTGKALGDIFTLGEEGRRRDHDRAQEAKSRANQQKKSEEDRKKNLIDQIDKELSTIEASLKFNDMFVDGLRLLRGTLVTSLQLTKFIGQAMRQSNLELSTVREMLASQIEDLTQLTQSAESSGQLLPHTEKEETRLAVAIKIYLNQLREIPRVESAGQPLSQELIAKALAAGIEAELYTKQLADSIAQFTIDARTHVAALKATRENLVNNISSTSNTKQTNQLEY